MFTENLDAFFDAKNGHAVDAVYDGATATTVIFDNEDEEGFGIAGTAPRVIGRASVFPVASASGKTLVIAGVTYTIRSAPKPVDDGAIVRLHLKKT